MFLTEHPREEKGQTIINMWERTGWGNSVQFTDYDKGSISGHLSVRLKIGDEVRSKMQSGKIGRFKIIAHRQCHDPSDMFFATVEAIGYVGEPEIVKVKKKFEWHKLFNVFKPKGETNGSISSNK